MSDELKFEVSLTKCPNCGSTDIEVYGESGFHSINCKHCHSVMAEIHYYWNPRTREKLTPEQYAQLQNKDEVVGHLRGMEL